MEMMIERVLILLTTPPGNIAYFLVLLLSIVGAFQGTWEKRGNRFDAGIKKIVPLPGCGRNKSRCCIGLVHRVLYVELGIALGQGIFHLVEDTCISIWNNLDAQLLVTN